MALKFGKSPRGAHGAQAGSRRQRQGAQAPQNGHPGRTAQQQPVQQANQMHAQGRYGRGDDNVAPQNVNRNGKRDIAAARGAGMTGSFPAANDSLVATEATGSYADLAAQEGQRVNLGPVVIALRNVTKVYTAQPDKPALKGLTLDIRAGEFVFLVGHSGSGKSTFIRMLNREVVPTSGDLMVAGENLRTIRNWRVPYLRRNVGCVFQDFKLLPNKTARENVAFALEAIGKSRHVIKTQVPEVLRLVGLEEKMDKYPDQLSGGEQQRVSIARSIVNRPPLLICDEPTGNLDPQTSLGIMRLLERINRTGTTVLVATHDREMVDQMRRRVLALENGVLVRDQSKGVYGYDL